MPVTAPANRAKASGASRLDIVLVNWNSGDGLEGCLQAIAGSSRQSFVLGSVIVVDNGSTDGSMDAVDRTQLPVKVVRNGRNLGFAAACNRGAARSDGDYLLFLNPDTRLDRDALDCSIAFMDRPGSLSIGICGIQLRDEHGRIARTCAVFPTFGRLLSMTFGLSAVPSGLFQGVEMRNWDHLDSRRVNHVMGAYYLVRRAVFASLGGFDERFFVYFEDLDFSARAAKAGWQSQYLAGVSAWHESGGSSKRARAARLFYACRSRVQLAWKHLPSLQAATITIAVLGVEPWMRALRAVATGDLVGLGEVATGTMRLWSDFAKSPRAFVGLGRRGIEGSAP